MKTVKILRRGLSLTAVVLLLGSHPAGAMSVSEPATPISGTSTPFVTPPVGDWVTTDADMDVAQEIRSAAYSMPQLNLCLDAPVTALNINIPTTTIVLNGTVTTQQQVGVNSSVYDMNSFDPVDAIAVHAGTRLDGALALALNPAAPNYAIVRGFTHGGWTTNPTPIPGAINYDLDTTGMTVADYNNLGIVVHHDLYDGVLATHADSITSAQPIVSVTADETVCADDEEDAQADEINEANDHQTPESSLADTGDSELPYIMSTATLLLDIGGLAATTLFRRRAAYEAPL